jgi:hypothetical protein
MKMTLCVIKRASLKNIGVMPSRLRSGGHGDRRGLELLRSYSMHL